jgi:hypothetical protein
MSSKLKPAKQNSQDGTGRTFASVARTPTAGRADAKPSTPGKAVKKTNANGKYLEVLAEVDNNKNYDGVSTHADADADPILPIVPANTSSNGTPVVTTPSKVAVADVLGHGWKSTSISTFPPTEFATFPAYKDANGTTGDGPVTPPRGHAATEVSGNGLGNVFGNATNTSNGTNGLGLCLGFGNGSSPPVFGNAGAYDGSRMRHHARSPSMPDLRRDGLRDVLGADPFGPYSPSPDRAALALQRLHLVPQPEVKVATAANAPKVKTQREEEDQWFTPRGFQYTNDHSPPTAPSILATPVTPVAALTAVGDSATDLYEDVGEGRNSEFLHLDHPNSQSTSRTFP